jgi:hypothetical protein
LVILDTFAIREFLDRYLPQTCRYDKLKMDTRLRGYDEETEDYFGLAADSQVLKKQSRWVFSTSA